MITNIIDLTQIMGELSGLDDAIVSLGKFFLYFLLFVFVVIILIVYSNSNEKKKKNNKRNFSRFYY